MKHIKRNLKSIIERDLQEEAGVVLLGPRQMGKTTLAYDIAQGNNGVYVDLESEQGRLRLRDPDAFFHSLDGQLAVLDEVQRHPELFASLRGIIDRGRRQGFQTGQMLLLGSASDKLLKQSSESLAGRVSYLELTGVNVLELNGKLQIQDLWLRGGYPRSLLASNETSSLRIRRNLQRSVIERDIPQIVGNFNGVAMDRFWRIIASLQGEPFNASKIAASIGVKSPTTKRYLDVFQDLMLVRQLRPWYKNSVKRLVKSPKVYVRDSGLLHSILGIETLYDLQGHHIYGHSWEGFVIEQIAQVIEGRFEMLFYRSSGGAEIDLILEGQGQLWAIEIKATTAPKISAGYFSACDDIKPSHKVVVHYGQDDFPYGDGVQAVSLETLLKQLS